MAQYHVSQGWPGIAYAFVVHWDGTVEYTQDVTRAGYTVAARNAECLSICLPGNWSLRQPPEAQIKATRRLLAELQYMLGWFCPVVGHKDVALEGWGTDCPGSTWPQWSTRVKVAGPEDPPSPPAYEFVLGFKELADRLGPELVGGPIENEHPGQIQETANGYMLWTPGKASMFVQKGVRR
jgi:hypothetical protein